MPANFSPLRPQDLPRWLKTKLSLPASATEVLLDGRWRLGDEIGAGGMGLLYRAEDTKLGKLATVVVKFVNEEPLVRALRNEGRSNSEIAECMSRFRERLQREAGSMKKLQDAHHPNVVRVIAYRGGGESPYIVMEHLDGEDLQKRASRRRHGNPWRFDEVQQIARQAASALRHVHKHGLVHRDVKTGNFYLRSDSSAKTGQPADLHLVLIDFGIVKDFLLQSLTQGLLRGTPAYASPEQEDFDRRDDVKFPTDIFSLGVVLAELCFGMPYKDPEHFPACTLQDPMPDWFRRMLVRMLDKSTEERPTADQLLATLDEYRSRMPTAVDSILKRLAADDLRRVQACSGNAFRRASGASADFDRLRKKHAAFMAASGEMATLHGATSLLEELETLNEQLGTIFGQSRERAVEEIEDDSTGSGLFGLSWTRASKQAETDPKALLKQLEQEVLGAYREFDRACEVCERLADCSDRFSTLAEQLRKRAFQVVKAVRETPQPSKATAREWLHMACRRGEEAGRKLAESVPEVSKLLRKALAAVEITLTRSDRIYIA
jgi:serine/threonine-protein kinase